MFFRIGMQPVQPVIHLGAGVGFPSSYIILAKPDVGNTSATFIIRPTNLHLLQSLPVAGGDGSTSITLDLVSN